MTAKERFKTSFFKVLPMGAGVLLGVLIVKPPPALARLGWPLYVLGGVLLVAFLVGLVVLLVAANLPQKLVLRLRTDLALPGQLGALVSQLRGLGFRDVGPSYEVAITPPATLVGLIDKDGVIYASVFQPGARGAAPAFDFVSLLAQGRGSLTSAETPLAASLPPRELALRQIFPGKSVADVLARHRTSLSVLRARGVEVREVSPDTFETDYRAAFVELRRAFVRRTVRNAFVTLWRSVTRRTPERGSVSEQPRCAAAIEVLAKKPASIESPSS